MDTREVVGVLQQILAALDKGTDPMARNANGTLVNNPVFRDTQDPVLGDIYDRHMQHRQALGIRGPMTYEENALGAQFRNAVSIGQFNEVGQKDHKQYLGMNMQMDVREKAATMVGTSVTDLYKAGIEAAKTDDKWDATLDTKGIDTKALGTTRDSQLKNTSMTTLRGDNMAIMVQYDEQLKMLEDISGISDMTQKHASKLTKALTGFGASARGAKATHNALQRVTEEIRGQASLEGVSSSSVFDRYMNNMEKTHATLGGGEGSRMQSRAMSDRTQKQYSHFLERSKRDGRNLTAKEKQDYYNALEGRSRQTAKSNLSMVGTAMANAALGSGNEELYHVIQNKIKSGGDMEDLRKYSKGLGVDFDRASYDMGYNNDLNKRNIASAEARGYDTESYVRRTVRNIGDRTVEEEGMRAYANVVTARKNKAEGVMEQAGIELDEVSLEDIKTSSAAQTLAYAKRARAKRDTDIKELERKEEAGIITINQRDTGIKQAHSLYQDVTMKRALQNKAIQDADNKDDLEYGEFNDLHKAGINATVEQAKLDKMNEVIRARKKANGGMRLTEEQYLEANTTEDSTEQEKLKVREAYTDIKAIVGLDAKDRQAKVREVADKRAKEDATYIDDDEYFVKALGDTSEVSKAKVKQNNDKLRASNASYIKEEVNQELKGGESERTIFDLGVAQISEQVNQEIVKIQAIPEAKRDDKANSMLSKLTQKQAYLDDLQSDSKKADAVFTKLQQNTIEGGVGIAGALSADIEDQATKRMVEAEKVKKESLPKQASAEAVQAYLASTEDEWFNNNDEYRAAYAKRGDTSSMSNNERKLNAELDKKANAFMQEKAEKIKELAEDTDEMVYLHPDTVLTIQDQRDGSFVRAGVGGL